MTRYEFDCYEPNAREKYEYNYERIFGTVLNYKGTKIRISAPEEILYKPTGYEHITFTKELTMPGMKATMKEFKKGTLKSSSGKKVTSRKQAIAIGLSEDRKAKSKRKNGKRK